MLPRRAVTTGGHDRVLTAWLLGLMLLQIALGALVRHYNAMVLVHVSLAAVVSLVWQLTAGFPWAVTLNAKSPIKWAGMAVLVIIGVQLVLGDVLLHLAWRPAEGDMPTAGAALLTTAHQANGALLLAATATLMLWTWRLYLPVQSC